MGSVIEAAKKTFVALKDPFQTVARVYPGAINAYHECDDVCYVGVKNVSQIPSSLLKTLQKDHFILHTVDAASIGGRAVDILHQNPLTGRPMTGSSSGTAINVLLQINDLGIGTDGGGSVLAPAMALHLYSFISSRIEAPTLQKVKRISTDGIAFSPSIGFLTREFSLLKRAIHSVLPIDLGKKRIRVLASDTLPPEQMTSLENVPELDLQKGAFPLPHTSREEAIAFLKEQLPRWDCLINWEGPVDYQGLGDTILGHFDSLTAADQARSGKGLVRVINMVNATGMTLPGPDFASGLLLIGRGDPETDGVLLRLGEQLSRPTDELLARYYGNLDAYFAKGFGEEAVYEEEQ